MKRIGILTFHRSVNNGAVMQAYSLSKRLAEEYPDYKVEIIDYNMEKVSDFYDFSFFKYLKTSPNKVTLIKRLLKVLLDPKMLKRLRQRTKIFDRAISILPLSNKSILSDSTDELYDYINKTYDILIVGSDAIWNYIVRGFPNAYLTGTEVHCKKLSYAASCFGMEFIEYSEKERDEIRMNLDDFSFIGVRDTATEEFVRWSGSSKIPVHTCDPTVFLNIDKLPIDEEEVKRKLRERGFDFLRPTIGMMGTDKMCSMIRTMYGSKYQIVALYEYVHKADVNLYDLNPYEWAYVFRYFQLVFTTYFHGTLLSLRNGVPLICISLNTDFGKKHTPKTLDILNRVGYSDWYFITNYKGKNYEKIKKKADELLQTDIKKEIIDRVNREAETFNNFNSALKKILDEMED